MVSNHISPYVITVCSGKGGVGKSVLAANLGFSLSKHLRVLVWDADMHFPNQHFLLGVEPPLRLRDVYAGRVSANQAIYQVSENLFILAEMPATGIEEQFHPELMLSVFADVAESGMFDVVIIDTPAGAIYEILQCSAFSDSVSIVITDEPTSLLDAYGLVKLLMPYTDPSKINLLVNNVIDYEDADDISKKLNLATKNFLNLNLDVLGCIPYDRMVRQSIMRQELFARMSPDSEVALALDKLSGTIIARMKVTELMIN